MGAAAERDGTDAPVVLTPGSTAHATLRIQDYATLPEGRCRPTAVAGFRVYPPDQTASAFVPAKGTACAATAESLLTVGPVRTGGPTE